jgi:hypothetical protein
VPEGFEDAALVDIVEELVVVHILPDEERAALLLLGWHGLLLWVHYHVDEASLVNQDEQLVVQMQLRAPMA